MQSDLNFVDSIISEIQTLLLAVMGDAVRKILSFKNSSSGTSNHKDQLDGHYLVDAAVAFCKLQHLGLSVPIKTQVSIYTILVWGRCILFCFQDLFIP